MRWLFLDDDHPLDRAYRREKLAQIDAWWRAFADAADDIDAAFSRRVEFDLPKFMQEHLHAIDEGLMWEYGPPVKGKGRRLVITPESRRDLRPLVSTILQRAPKLDRWEFFPYRLADAVEGIEPMMKARTGGSVEGVFVTAARAEGNFIHLCYYLPKCSGPEDKHADKMALVATETLLGEEILDKWIGGIEVAQLQPEKKGWFRRRKEAPPNLLPLDRLRTTVDAVITSTRDQLPAKPYYAARPDDISPTGIVYELKPQVADDYTGRRDVVIGSFLESQALFEALHAARFYSCRYSNHGDHFCFLKIDGCDRDHQGRFDLRKALEDVLSPVLSGRDAGSVLGGGTGLRYLSIDLALPNVNESVAMVREVLRHERVPRRAWLLFFENDLMAEWCGIYPNSPPPPMVDGIP